MVSTLLREPPKIKGGAVHQDLLKKFSNWILDEKQISLKSLIDVDYDKPQITRIEGAEDYFPDITINKFAERMWIEIETEQINILNKLSRLVYLKNFNPNFWPKVVFFVTPKLEGDSKNNFKKAFKQIKKLTKIKKIVLFMYDPHRSVFEKVRC